MSIKGYVEELKSIKIEIASNNRKNRELRLRANQIERHISGYLESKGHPGVKMDKTAVVINEKTTRPKKKKADKQESQVALLRSLNIQNPEQLLLQLNEVTLESPKKTNVLKFHQMK
tara:strand:- start:213 stop:563 length:351 start_codon:yes stop_codon:yes gene_type:complete